MAWFITGIIAAPIMWFIFKVVLGAAAAPEVSGKQLLKQELRKLGVKPFVLPEACLDDFVQSCKHMAEMTKDTLHHGYFSSAFADSIEGTALNIARYLNGMESGAIEHPEDNYCYQILLRHGVVQSPTSGREGSNPSPEVLHYKSPEAAFEYICKFMATAPQEGHALPGIVSEIAQNGVMLKMPDDNNGFINRYPALARNGIPPLASGDFVLVGIDEVLSDGMKGTVIATLEPSYHLVQETWKIKDAGTA